MPTDFKLEYWQEGEWFVGRLLGVPGVFSQGATLDELEDNVRDAYRMMAEGEASSPAEARTKPIVIDV